MHLSHFLPMFQLLHNLICEFVFNDQEKGKLVGEFTYEIVQELEGQCQNEKEEFAEVLKELEFYKKRKMLDMQKLLNDT